MASAVTAQEKVRRKRHPARGRLVIMRIMEFQRSIRVGRNPKLPVKRDQLFKRDAGIRIASVATGELVEIGWGQMQGRRRIVVDFRIKAIEETVDQGVFEPCLVPVESQEKSDVLLRRQHQQTCKSTDVAAVANRAASIHKTFVKPKRAPRQPRVIG